MPTRKVVEFLEPNGSSPYAKWFARLDAVAAAKVATALYRMEQGNLSNVKAVGQGVAEYRIDFGPGYRIYIGQDGDVLIILLGGGTKKGQNADIQLAQQRWRDYNDRHGWRKLEQRREQLPDAQEEVSTMPITRKFRDTVWTRAQSDTRFRTAMLTEAINELLAGDLDTGKAMLRDYVNASITFDGLAKATRLPTKSLQRMLGPRGNPTAESLFAIFKVLQKSERIRLAVTHKRAA